MLSYTKKWTQNCACSKKMDTKLLPSELPHSVFLGKNACFCPPQKPTKPTRVCGGRAALGTPTPQTLNKKPCSGAFFSYLYTAASAPHPYRTSSRLRTPYAVLLIRVTHHIDTLVLIQMPYLDRQ